MSINHRKEGLRNDYEDEPDLFASWEPVVNVNNLDDKMTAVETEQLATNNEFAHELIGKERRNPSSSSDNKNEVWLDPCKFSGRVIRQSEVNKVPLSTCVIPDERTENISDANSQGIVTRKITVLPPSAGYRGFCNVSDLSDTQRQPWKRLKSESKTQVKETLVKEFISPDGKKVKMMRLPDEDPPKKIKKVQIENTDTSNVKNDLKFDEFEPLKRLEIPSRRKVKTLKNSLTELTVTTSKEMPAHEMASSTSPKNKSKHTVYLGKGTSETGKLIKRHYVEADKKPIKKELSQKVNRERSINTIKSKQNSNIVRPAKRYKRPEVKKEDCEIPDTFRSGDESSKGKDDGDDVDETAAGSENILKDLESVKAKLALLSEEIGGDKENAGSGDEKNESEVNEDVPEYQMLSSSPVKSPLKKMVLQTTQKPDQAVKSKVDESKFNEDVDNSKRKICERNETDRKAAKEYMRMKKAQWKEQQANEQDRKRQAVEARRLKLQQLQETQVKLLKQSIKKKPTAVEAQSILASLVNLLKH